MGKLQQEIRKREPFASSEQEAVLNLFRTSDRMQHRFARLFREYGLTPSQYNILRILTGRARPCLAWKSPAHDHGGAGHHRADRPPGAVRAVSPASTPRRTAASSTCRSRRPARRFWPGWTSRCWRLHRKMLAHFSAQEMAELTPTAGEGPPRLRGGVGLTGTPFALRAKGDSAELVRLQAERMTRKAKR